MTESLYNDRQSRIEIDALLSYVKELNTPYSKINADLYHNLGSPLLDNDISVKFQQFLFHTTPGRTLITGYIKFSRQLVQALTTFFGFSLYKTAEYIISISGSESNGVMVNILFSFVILWLASTVSEMIEQLLVDRMGGNANVIEYTEEDIRSLKKQRN